MLELAVNRAHLFATFINGDQTMRIFLSYAREDIAWAEEQSRVLEPAGVEVYLDVRSNRAGEPWEERIHTELERASQVRVGWSRHAAQSEWVRREYMWALERAASAEGTPGLLVYLLDDTELPEELRHIHAERSLYAKSDVGRILRDVDRDARESVLTPSALLRPENRIVPPFPFREPMLDELKAWCMSERAFDLALYVGPGGTGKTRLLIELCVRLREQNWETGFLNGDMMKEALHSGPERINRLFEPRIARLMVLDYAESRRDQVAAILQRATRRSNKKPVRVVLLARNAGEWWRELLQQSRDFAPLLGNSAEPRLLPPLAPDAQQRREAYHAALQAFADFLGIQPPARPRSNFSSPQLSHALFVHLAALLDVLGERRAAPAELMPLLLEHEERYWNSVADDVGLQDGRRAMVAPVLALATLQGGVEQGEALDAILARLPLLAELPELQRRPVGEVLRRLYGWGGAIEPLQPDRVGEALVAREMMRDAQLRRTWHVDADATQLRHGLVVLGRIAAEREDARLWLGELISLRLAEIGSSALQVALEGSPWVGRALAAALRANPDPELALRLERDVPESTVLLREAAAVVTEQAMAWARDAGDEGEYAKLLNSLAMRLRALGRYGQALAAALEATEIRRSLAEADPETYLPRLGTSLNSLAVLFSDLGLRKEAVEAAQEATDIRTRLAAADPERYLPRLATSLNNLGIRLRELGQFREALVMAVRSMRIRRKLVRSDPAGLSNLASSQNSAALSLHSLGRDREALNAVRRSIEIRRRLAESDSDAHLPDLASSLDNLGEILRALGRNDEALTALQEAVEIYGRLAEVHPDVFHASFQASSNAAAALVTEQLRLEPDSGSPTEAESPNAEGGG